MAKTSGGVRGKNRPERSKRFGEIEVQMRRIQYNARSYYGIGEKQRSIRDRVNIIGRRYMNNADAAYRRGLADENGRVRRSIYMR